MRDGFALAAVIAAVVALAGCEGLSTGRNGAPPPQVAAPAPPIAALPPQVAASAPPATPLVSAPAVETAAPAEAPKAGAAKPAKGNAAAREAAKEMGWLKTDATARDLANALADTNVDGSKDGLITDVEKKE